VGSFRNNTFSSRGGAGPYCASSTTEVHGDNTTVTDNTITGYAIGMNVSGSTFDTSSTQYYYNNHIGDANVGFSIYSDHQTGIPGAQTTGNGLQNVQLNVNEVYLNPQGWLANSAIEAGGFTSFSLVAVGAVVILFPAFISALSIKVSKPQSI
jgi:hypothetical protein